ncbi:hypothetical protein EDD86DRAFT_201771 [Gorgonomyces haynaldii]|nr:hypothetical protein EDD86DRAFT_201771 [Gorgonomyces haynaldii]
MAKELSTDIHSQDKKRFASELQTLGEIFSDWTQQDLVAILLEVNGDIDLAIARISEGHAEQWGEVKNGKKLKPKKDQTDHAKRTPTEPESKPAPARGAQPAQRGNFRGGRGGHRGARGGRGRGGYQERPRRQEEEKPTKEWATNGWEEEKPVKQWDSNWNDDPAWNQQPAAQWDELEQATEQLSLKPKPKQEKKPQKPAEKPKGTWASLVKGPEPVVAEKEPEKKIEKKSPVFKEKEIEKPISPVVEKRTRTPSPVRPAQPVQQEIQGGLAGLQLQQEPEKPSNTPPGLQQRQQPSRKANQAVPVVLPQNASPAQAGLQFGSFSQPQEQEPAQPAHTRMPSGSLPNGGRAVEQAPGLSHPPMHGVPYMQGVPAFDYSAMYTTEQARALGYYPADMYGKYGDSVTSASASPAQQPAGQFPMYGYYPYYMPNQYQSGYQNPQMYNQQYMSKYPVFNPQQTASSKPEAYQYSAMGPADFAPYDDYKSYQPLQQQQKPQQQEKTQERQGQRFKYQEPAATQQSVPVHQNAYYNQPHFYQGVPQYGNMPGYGHAPPQGQRPPAGYWNGSQN